MHRKTVVDAISAAMVAALSPALMVAPKVPAPHAVKDVETDAAMDATAVVAVAAAVVNAKAAHSANASVQTANPWQPMRRRYKAPRPQTVDAPNAHPVPNALSAQNAATVLAEVLNAKTAITPTP